MRSYHLSICVLFRIKSNQWYNKNYDICIHNERLILYRWTSLASEPIHSRFSYATPDNMMYICIVRRNRHCSNRMGNKRYMFHLHELIIIPAWIRNSIPSNLWKLITCPFPNFSCTTVQVLKWISNIFLHTLDIRVLIHAGIKVNPCEERGSMLAMYKITSCIVVSHRFCNNY